MHKSFEIVQRREIHELGSSATLYRHSKTGAELLSVENDDTNKVFGAAFRTPPDNSTGVAHILEHSVLCGSRKYPAKDPFVQLLKGSLQTFLNAMTYPDKTVYPVASQNLADFYNLIDVYLDAVFYPRITPEIFEQEGWHYEYDPKSDRLSYRGVVYNEMKGNYSSPDYLVYEQSQNSIFPDTTYGNDSGGDPDAITELSYKEFKSFHEDFYHPSNARLFFWGDDDPAERLRRSAEYLDAFEHRRIDSSIALQSRFSSPIRRERKYAAGSEEMEDNRVTLTWLLPDVSEPRNIMEFNLLEYLLIDTSASPLRKALIDSGIGADITGSGIETSTRQIYFSTGLKGVKTADIEKVEPLIMRTLAAIADEGFGADLVESALNTIEFSLRENNTGRTPRGLSQMLRTLKTWLHDYDPLESMAYEERLNSIKAAAAADPRYFERMIEKHLVENPHRSTLKLLPDAELAERHVELEDEELRRKRAEMSAAQIGKIVAANKLLQDMQETPDTPEVLAKIPALSIGDIPLKNEVIPAEISAGDEIELIHHDLFTNNILYLEVGFNAESLPEEDLPYLNLLSDALLDMGTTEEDYVSLTNRIGSKTGGIDASLLLATTKNDLNPRRYLQIRGKCVVDRVPELLSIYQDMLQKLDLDNGERFLQIVLEAKADAEESLLPAGHQVTAARLNSRLSFTGRTSDKATGVDMLIFLRNLVPEIKSDWPRVRQRLKDVHAKVLNRAGMYCNATIDSENWALIKDPVAAFCGELPGGRRKPPAKPLNPTAGHEFLTAETQVQYVGKAVRIRNHGQRVKGSEMVVIRYLRTAWLWDQIRLQGGAYGAVAGIGQYSGIFSMVSYRDPHLDRTLEIYDETYDYLIGLNIDPSDLERAIIGTIGDIDTYRLPDAKGHISLIRHLTGQSQQELQRMRDEVLATTPDDFRAFGEAISNLAADGTVVVLGEKSRLTSSRFGQENRDTTITGLL